MDQEHPIPQQISSYQFRLVGDMTLKQFFQVAGGALVSLLFYASDLHPIVKWPLIIVSFLFGVALAFLPLQDRPLYKWILLFFKSVYSPTLFSWKKAEKEPMFFQAETPAQEPATAVQPPSVQPPQVATPPADKKGVPPPVTSEQPEKVIPPAPIKAPTPGYLPSVSIPTTEEKPPPTIKKREVLIPEKEPSATRPAAEGTVEGVGLPAPATPLPEPIAKVLTQLEEGEKTFLSKITDLFRITPAAVPKTGTPQAKRPGDVSVPGTPQVTLSPQEPKRQTPKEKGPAAPGDIEAQAEAVTRPVAPAFAERGATSGQSARFSPQAAPPAPPTMANTIAGQIMDPEGKIVEGAILEIKDSAGRPVRALKSNKLGHFAIVTPLVDGKYEIITEKEGLVFEPITLEATGATIPPIAIRAKEKVSNGEEQKTSK